MNPSLINLLHATACEADRTTPRPARKSR